MKHCHKTQKNNRILENRGISATAASRFAPIPLSTGWKSICFTSSHLISLRKRRARL